MLFLISESLHAQLTSCTGIFYDNASNTSGNETISPTAAKRIKLKIVFHNNASLKIYEGTNNTGTLLYDNDGSFSVSDSVIYTGYSSSASSVYIEYTNSNSIINDEYQIDWLGIIDADGTAYNVKCNGQNDGIANISINGGTSPYSISWSSGETTENITNLSPGDYSVTVTDNNSCKFDTTYTIKQPEALTVSSEVIKNNCTPGGSNGELKITAQGGSSPYDYSWSQGETTQIISNLSSGTYNYTVTDVQGCENTGSATVAEPITTLSSSVTSSTNVQCKGENTGSITINGVDGHSPYSYQWDENAGNSTSQTVSNLLAGTYHFTITDNYKCSVLGNHTITEPTTTLAINLTEKTNASHYNAKDGEIKIDPSGVQGTANYSWTGPDITNTTEKNQSNLGAGTYNVTLSDDYCSTNENYEITQPNIIYAGTIQINSGTSTSVCNGIIPPNILSSENADGPNTFTYSWKFSADNSTWSDTSSVSTASYTFQDAITKSIYAKRIATDNTTSNIVESNTIFIKLNKLTVSSEILNNVLCNSGSTGKARVLVSEGTRPYTYSFSGIVTQTDSLIEDLAATNYNYTVTDDNTCTKSGIITITEPTVLSVTFNDSSNYNSYGVSCNGNHDGWIEITVSGGTSPYSYDWRNSSGSIGQATVKASNLPPETYSCIVTDDNNCPQTISSLTMTAPAALNSGEIEINGSNTDYVCEGENSFTFSEKTAASGGLGNYTYSWQSSSDNSTWTTIASNITPPNYTWNHTLTTNTYIRRIVNDGATNAISNSIFLNFIPNTSLSVSNLETEYCYNNDTVTVIGSPTNSNGVFSGEGILSSHNGIAKFLPSSADTTTVNPVTVTYTYTDHGCISVLNKSVIIHPLPNPYFSIPAKIAKQDSSFTITQKSHFGSGIFSGEGITPDGTLYTRNLNIGTTYNITYKVDSAYGCSNTATHHTLIIKGTGKFFVDAALTIELGDKFCFDGDSIMIYANSFNSDTAGSFESPIINIARKKGSLNPSNYSGNSNNEYTIKYNYSGNDGAFTIEKTIYVYNVTNKAQIFDLDNSYCNYKQVVSINAKSLHNGDIGVFSGYGITDNSDATASFDIGAASAYSNPIKVKYLYTHNESSCKDSVIQDVTINNLPALSFNLPIVYNVDGENDTLQATPKGGEYSPAQYFINDSIFVPQYAGLGNKTITYKYTDENQCVDSINKNTTIDKYTGNIINLNNYYCYDGVIDTISVSGITNPSGAIGHFYGYGVVNLGNNLATFNPKTAYDNAVSGNNPDSLVIIKIEFKYTGIDDSTIFTISLETKVRNNGEVHIENINDTRSYCANDEPIELNATPSGGTFSGEGMNNNTFYPSNVTRNYTVIGYVYSDNDVGCTIQKNDTIKILEVPSPNIIMPYQICSNSASDTIIGLPRGGTISSETLMLFPIESNSDSVRFTPDIEYIGINNIKYTYTDPSNGCTNSIIKQLTVDTIPSVSIELDMPNSGFCFVNEPTKVLGIVNEVYANSGIFTGNGIVDTTLNTGKAQFNPYIAGVGNKKVIFTYKDNNGCVNTSEFNIKINPLPNVSISGLNSEKAYCANNTEPVTLIGTPTLGTTIFFIDNQNFNTSTVQFIPENYSNKDTVLIKYYNKDINECENQITEEIIIKKIPDISFELDNICITDSIKFTYLGNTPIDSITSILWNFGDDSTSTELNPVHKYNEAKDVRISLNLSTTNGCSNDTLSNVISLENNPNADFTWRHECEGENVTFISASDDNSTYYSYLWDFGDNTTSTEYQPVHKYNSKGEYHIKRTVKSTTPNSTCKTTVSNTIYVRPVYNITKDNSYQESFENGHGFWIPKSLNGNTFSWQYGIPNGKIINKAADGINVYVTNLDTFYYSNENSAVYSPCFDFTNAKKPMINMSIFKQIENTRDGAVLEYSSDAGITWNAIGKVNQGINWYNSYNITTKPGNMSSQGWTDTVPDWTVASNYIDYLKGKTNIQFRIAFAADNTIEYEGFAFDNIFIGERTKKVLIEHFTSTEQNDAINSNRTINNIVDDSPLDVIDIQYHSSIYPNDDFYKDYPIGTGTRESYYGINSVPYSIFEGNMYFDFSQDNKPNVDIVKDLALNKPEFSITINTTDIADGFNIELKLKANSNINNKQLQLFTAVVEKAVTLNQNSQLVFQNVLRKFVPTPGGKYINKDWTIGQTQSFNFEYKIDNYIKNPDSLIVIAFIQDERTKNILQTVTNDKTTIGTAIKPWLKANQDLDYILYPNPANDIVYFAFGTFTSTNSMIQIINNTGKVVKTIDLPAEINSFNISVSDLSQGLYFIRWINSDKQKIKKIIIK
jgi:hypothetical protein